MRLQWWPALLCYWSGRVTYQPVAQLLRKGYFSEIKIFTFQVTFLPVARKKSNIDK